MGAVQVVSIIAALALGVLARPQEHNLPVLFSFSQPSHNVAVYRGAALQNAIASGAIQGFGNLGNGGGLLHTATAPVSRVTPVIPAPTQVVTPVVHRPVPAPVVTPVVHRPVVSRPVVSQPVVSHAVVSQPVVSRPVVSRPVVSHPVVSHPVVSRPVVPQALVSRPVVSQAVVSRPVVSHPVAHVEPVYGEDAEYTYEYSVLDDYSGNNFGAKESRSGALTNGQYYVALPDGRLQTVTYVVDGDLGYVADVQYQGEAQYPVSDYQV